MQVPGSPRLWLAAVPVLAAFAVTGLAVVLAAGDGGDGEDAGGRAPAGVPPLPLEGGKPSDVGGGGGAVQDQEAQVSRAVREYVEAIDAGDGARVCGVLAPGAIESFQLPRERGGCAGSIGASIGHRDPRGFPVLDRARLDSIDDVAVGAGEARVRATITRFAGRAQPAVESDLIYLVETEGEWRIARPSATLYRAVGRPEVPPQALAAPG